MDVASTLDVINPPSGISFASCARADAAQLDQANAAATPQHRIYPLLLRDLAIMRSNQVWCADVTYLPKRRGILYLASIMGRVTHKVLAWRISNTMDAAFCVEALQDAMVGAKPDDRIART